MGGETRWVAMSDSGSRSLFSKCMYVPGLFVTSHELIQSKPLWFLNNFYWSCLSGEKPPKCRFFTMQALLPIPVAPFKKKQTASGVEIKLFATWPCMWTFSLVLEENSSRLVPYSDDSNLCFLCFKKELQYGSTGSGALTKPVMVANRVKAMKCVHRGMFLLLFCVTVCAVSFLWFTGHPLWDWDYYLCCPGTAFCYSDASGGVLLCFVSLL